MKNQLLVTISTDNAAFDGDPIVELARLLRETATRLVNGSIAGVIRDVNGNAVGEFIYTERADRRKGARP